MGYMKIENMYRNADIMLFKQCYALEKVHGTSAHIQWSKGHVSFYSGGEKHDNFVALFDQEKLTEFFKVREYPEDIVIRIHGEAYGGKQQGMSKTYGAKLCFIAFDVRIGDLWLDVPKAEDYCLQAGIEFIPYAIVGTSEAELNAERDRDSTVAIRRGMGEGHIREGVVLRPPFEVRLNSGSRLIAKHKRDEFRETKSPRLDINPDKLKVLEEAEAIAEEWCVPMRLQHVIGKMTVDGVEPDMKNMGDIIKNMIDDIYVEGKGEIIEGREVAKAIGTKTVQLFKKYLHKKNIGE
jgi:RNA ligase